MKIALITRRYPPLIGGAEKVLSYLAAALATEGHQVRVYTSSLGVEDLPSREWVPTSAARWKWRGWGRHECGLWARGCTCATWRSSFGATRRTWLMCRCSSTMRTRRLEPRVRGTGFRWFCVPEGAGATGDIAWQGWGRFGRKIAARCREASAFVSISKPIERELLEAWTKGAPGRFENPLKIVSIPNGVPVPEVPWQRRAGWREAPQAVYLGRLAPRRAWICWSSAGRGCWRRFPSARLTLWGDGPERAALEAMVKRLGLTEAVAMPGPTTEPIEALRKADLFVLPSREEGMSISLLEAMGLGIPVVASSIPGNRKLVADFKQGRLFPSGDEAGLARTILEQWSDYDRAFHMARAARGLVEQKYSIRAVARKHLELFEELLREPAAKRQRETGR